MIDEYVKFFMSERWREDTWCDKWPESCDFAHQCRCSLIPGDERIVLPQSAP